MKKIVLLLLLSACSPAAERPLIITYVKTCEGCNIFKNEIGVTDKRKNYIFFSDKTYAVGDTIKLK